MAVQTAAGSKVYIGPVNSTASTSGDYEALTYSEIGEIESVGEFGDRFNEVAFTALSDRRVRKFKGSVNAGNLSLNVAFDVTDTGQADIQVALDTDFDYAFKVELSDEGSGSPSSPTTFYFRGKVMSYTINPGDAENIVRSTVDIGINSPIVEVAAV